MKLRFLPFGAAFVAFSSPVSAATVQLGVDDADVTINDRVGEAAYRLKQGGWDQMLSNGANPSTANDMTAIDYSGASALNNTTWDFSLTYESGDDGVQGFTFVMEQLDGPRNGTLVYDANNPLNGQTPTGEFNAILIEAHAGSLLDPTSYIETAYMDITDLTFTSALSSSGALENPLDAYSPSPGDTEASDRNWITSSVNLSLVDWMLTGTVQGGHDCNGANSAGCLTEDSLRMNVTIVEASVVPIPAAVWLFGSALVGMLGWAKRRSISV